MKKITASFVILLVGLFISGVAIAGVYKWVDENGVVHFSDSPPTHGKQSGKVEALSRHKGGAPAVSYADHGSPGGSSNNSKTQKHKAPTVELYVTSWCPYCKKASSFFRSRGIPFREYDIEKNKSAASRKRQLDDQKGVPFALINGQKIHGYSAAAYEKALKN